MFVGLNPTIHIIPTKLAKPAVFSIFVNWTANKLVSLASRVLPDLPFIWTALGQ